MCLGGGPKRDPDIDRELDKQREEQDDIERQSDLKRREVRSLLTESLIQRTLPVGYFRALQTPFSKSPKSLLLELSKRGGAGRRSLLTSGTGGQGFR